jgi:hypothetical protein
MNAKPHLIYKSHMTYFQTYLPVYFFGMPNGRICCIYGYFAQETRDEVLDFVFAELDMFSYDYDTETILLQGLKSISTDDFKEMADQPELRITPLKTHENFGSYVEAFEFLKYKARRNTSEMQLAV